MPGTPQPLQISKETIDLSLITVIGLIGILLMLPERILSSVGEEQGEVLQLLFLIGWAFQACHLVPIIMKPHLFKYAIWQVRTVWVLTVGVALFLIVTPP